MWQGCLDVNKNAKVLIYGTRTAIKLRFNLRPPKVDKVIAGKYEAA